MHITPPTVGHQSVLLHGGYVASAADPELKWFAREMQNQYECKAQISGPERGDDTSANILNMKITWQTKRNEDMIIYEADPRHAEIIIKERGLENARSLSSPAVKI